MKIAFLNPWKNAAENQAFQSLHEAAARIGHELLHCGNSAEVDACQPDFVLASASTQPKLNDVPHYGTIHEPRDRFLENRDHFHNLLSYDGYLTIADSLERFLRHLSYGVGRPDDVGFYYNTCQRQQSTADLPALLREHQLVVTYFGTNWDHRRTRFFRLLSETDGVEICGPALSWPDINPAAYGGALPFDGKSVQARYARNGVGLCLLSDRHLKDDIISNRLFEIASVGAIAICCDLPWIRRHFGDSAYYVDQNLPDAALVRAVRRRVAEIYANPDEAIAKARRARTLFEEKFAAEVLLANAVGYHCRITTRRDEALADAKRQYEPLISVIVRCGNRPLALVARAFESLRRQRYGRFEIIFVRHADIDLSDFCTAAHRNIESVKVVDCPRGNRSATLWAGLNAVTGEYFAVLDDDDWLFSNHFEQLFQPFPRTAQTRFLAYAGSISDCATPNPIMGGGADRRQLFRFGISDASEMMQVSGAFASNCFVASTDLLHADLRRSPDIETAEDSYLILSLLAQTTPRFSFAATSIHQRGHNGQSDFSAHPSRLEDELALQLRLLGKQRPSFAPLDVWGGLYRMWTSRPVPAEEELPDAADRVVYRIKGNHLSRAAGTTDESAVKGWESKGSGFWGKSEPGDPSVGTACIQTPEAAWAYAAALVLRGSQTIRGECLVVVEVRVEDGEIGVGLLNGTESDFVFRRPLRADDRVQEIHVPVSDLKRTGRLVIQNWQNPGKARAMLLGVKVVC